MSQNHEQIKADLKAIIDAIKDPRISLAQLRQMFAGKEVRR